MPKLRFKFAKLRFGQEHDRREKETEAHYPVALSVLYYPIVVCFTAENNDQARDKHQKTLLYFSSLVGTSRTFNEDLF